MEFTEEQIKEMTEEIVKRHENQPTFDDFKNAVKKDMREIGMNTKAVNPYYGGACTSEIARRRKLGEIIIPKGSSKTRSHKKKSGNGNNHKQQELINDDGGRMHAKNLTSGAWRIVVPAGVTLRIEPIIEESSDDKELKILEEKMNAIAKEMEGLRKGKR